jgi:hypothetical protein
MLRFGVLLISFWFLGQLFCAAQTEYPKEPEEFAGVVKSRLADNKMEDVQLFLKQFRENWEQGSLTDGEKKRLINQANAMHKKNWRLYPHIANVLRTMFVIRGGYTRVNIRSTDYMNFIDSCIKKYDEPQTTKLVDWLEYFAKTGIVWENKHFKWKLNVTQPTFGFIEDTNFRGVRFPGVQFNRTSFTFVTRGDSGTIENTSGFYNINKEAFWGHGGSYSWSRLGKDPKALYVQLPAEFYIDVTSINFQIDSVSLRYPKLTKDLIKGTLKEHLVHQANPETAEYPYFISTKGNVFVPNIEQNVDFRGKLLIKGLRLIGSRHEEIPAQVFIKNAKGVKSVTVRSDELVMDPDKLETERAQVTVHLPENDSLYHGSIKLVYTVPNQDIRLYIDRKDKRSSQPILNSYSQYGMYFDALNWNINTDSIRFYSNVAQEFKTFSLESFDYFEFNRYRKQSGIMNFNPITTLYYYYLFQLEKYKEKEEKKKPKKSADLVEEFDSNFSFDDYDKSTGKTKKSGLKAEDAPDEMFDKPHPSTLADNPKARKVKIDFMLNKYKLTEQKAAFMAALPELSGAGYIDYSQDGEYVYIKDMLIKWGKAAAAHKDYDAVYIPSNVEKGFNARLSKESKSMIMEGVQKFQVSDSQYVEFHPKDERVWVERNRNFSCSGLIKAGKINLRSTKDKSYTFDYDNFRVNCDSIQELSFSPRRDKRTRKIENVKMADGLEKLKLENMTGTIYIDRPSHKSGVNSAPFYSAFDSHTPAYVYWSDPTIQGGIYERKRLNFKVDPFVIDSLMSFNMEKLNFMGELNCPEIFPVFRDTLRSVSDYSYGISQTMPEEGTEIYGGKGKFFNQLHLDRFGLHGKGQINYRTTVVHSDTIVFHFDSVMAKTHSFHIPTGLDGTVNFPDMVADTILYKWYTKRDELVLQTQKKPIVLFDGRALFKGQIRISNTNIVANGSFKIGIEELTGDSIVIDNQQIDMRRGFYKINHPTTAGKNHLVAREAKVNCNMIDSTTQFSVPSSRDQPYIGLPTKRFLTNLAAGTFSHAKQEYSLFADSSNYRGPFYMASTDSNMHGLKFNVQKVAYNVNSDSMGVSGADSIPVADAIIYPDSGEVLIVRDGKIDSLFNCKIAVKGPKILHPFFDATCKIHSGISYRADASYKYIPIDSVDQIIQFNNIFVRPDTVTVAKTIIPEQDSFFITERFYFKDTVELYGDKRFMSWKGFVKIQSSNPALSKSWIRVNIPNANPDSITVPISKEAIGDQEIGIFTASDRHGYYSLFLRNKLQRKDQPILQAEGAVTFDRRTKEFRIGPIAKLKKEVFKGNVVSYLDQEDTLSVVTSRGYLNFPVHYKPTNEKEHAYELQMAGLWKQDQAKRTINTNLMLRFTFPELVLEPMTWFGNYMKTNLSLSKGDMNMRDRLMQENAAELMDKDDPKETKIQEILGILQTEPAAVAVDIASRMPASLVLSGVQLRYCESDAPGASGFFITEAPVGVVSFGGKSINQVCAAKIIYRIGLRSPTGKYQPDLIQIYLDLTKEGDWIFLEMKDNQLKVISSNDYYNNLATNASNKVNKKNKGLDTKFDFLVAEPTEKVKFLQEYAKLSLHGCNN